MKNPSLLALALLVIAVLPACAQEEGSEPVAAVDHALQEAPIPRFATGPDACTLQQWRNVAEVTRLAQKTVQTPEFAQCLRARVLQDYMPCRGDDHGGDATLEHANDVLSLLRNNDAPIQYQCDETLSEFAGRAPYGEFDHDRSLTVKVGVPDRELSRSQKAILGGTVAHEVTHTHGYRHDNCNAGAQYIGNVNSMPNIVGDCVRVSAMAHRVEVRNSSRLRNATTSAVLLPGANYDPSSPDFSALDNRISSMVVPPGHRALFCANPTGTRCDTVEVSGFFATRSAVPGRFAGWNFTTDLTGHRRNNAISWFEVEPVVTGFSQTYYRGARMSFAMGTHRATQGEFGPLGDNQMRSIHVPAGLMARICQRDVVGGAGWCAQGITVGFGELSDIHSRFDRTTSYLDVVPVATVFSEPEFLGLRHDLEVGRTYRASDGTLAGIGNDVTSSFVIPRDVKVRMCTSEGWGNGGGTCRTFRRSEAHLGALNDRVSFIQVSFELRFSF
jgi:hypothetical protein